jgi:magnesium transporter
MLDREIRRLLKKDNGKLKELLDNMAPPAIADIMEELKKTEALVLFRLLSEEDSAKVFRELDPQKQIRLVELLDDKEIALILKNLNPDDRTALFEEMPSVLRRKMFTLLSPEDVKEAKTLLGYPENSAGRLMTPDYVSVRPEWTVKQALRHIRRTAEDSETINKLYVVDRSGVMIDDITLRALVLAKPEQRITQLIDRTFVSIMVHQDQEEAVLLMRKFNLLSMPVLDSKGRLLGIITVDDIMEVEQEEVSEDFERLAGVSVKEGEPDVIENFRDASSVFLFRKRIGWLLILVFVNIFSGTIIASFEETIARYVVLVFFLPLLIGSGGNAGAQSATLMVRALAVGDVQTKDWAKVMGREMFVSLLLGMVMGVAVSFIGLFRGGTEIAMVVTISMVSIVIIGSMIGMFIPFLFTRLGRDPAAASIPLITSICDIVGGLIYLSVATWLLML